MYVCTALALALYAQTPPSSTPRSNTTPRPPLLLLLLLLLLLATILRASTMKFQLDWYCASFQTPFQLDGSAAACCAKRK